MLKKLFPYGLGERKHVHTGRGIINQSVYDKPMYKRSELGYVHDLVKAAPTVKDGISLNIIKDGISLNIINVYAHSSYSTEALIRNTDRRYLYFKNIDTANNIFVGFGSAVLNVDSSNMQLTPGEEKIYEMKVPLDSIHIRSLVGTPTLVIGEGI